MSHQLHSLLQYVCTPPDQPPGGNAEAPILVNEAMHIKLLLSLLSEKCVSFTQSMYGPVCMYKYR